MKWVNRIILGTLFLAAPFGVAEATVHNINVGNFFFIPGKTVANVGDTIQWTFVAGSHSSTSDPSSPKAWDSGVRTSGTFQIVIRPADGPGPFPYHCIVHPVSMKDTIFVSLTNDGDGDAIPDVLDNCPFNFNPTQLDFDTDGVGDVCDVCPGFDDNVDTDSDAWPAGCDCNDGDPSVYPGAPEIACDGIDQDCDGIDAGNDDPDGDGFSQCAGDCNSADPSIYPGATEISCDGVDQDCNGFDLGTEDVDGDGVDFCTGDCNDGDPSVYPGAPEIACDGIDQDCDGVDLGNDDPDGDGFSQCAGDCNSADPSIYPGATEISCDGIDQDCNGFDLGTEDVDGDGVDFCTGDCNDGDPSIYPGAPEIPNDGIDQDCDGQDATGCCQLRVGDANGNGDDEPTIGDISALNDALFITGTCAGILNCLHEADVNQSGGLSPMCEAITIGDISILIDYLFISGAYDPINNQEGTQLPDCL